MTSPAGVVPGDDEMFKSADRSNQSQSSARNDAQTATKAGVGALLEEPDEKVVAETITKWLRDQARNRKRRRVIATRNRYWMKGIRGVRIRPTNEDVTDVELYVPLGAMDLPPVMERTEELVERVVAHLMSDEPEPDAEPEDDSDLARESAEVTSRILTIEGAESGFNLSGNIRRAIRKGAIHGSGFLYPCVDATGNGWRPMEVKALSTATTVQDAAIDPQTRMPVASDDQLITRYVRPDKTLTDDPNEANKQWLPKIRVEVLTPEHVAFIPEACSGIGDANGVLIVQFPMLSDAKAKFPILAKMADPDIRTLLGWRPDETKMATPLDAAGMRARSAAGNSGDKIDDSARLCTVSLYFRSHGAYPKGAYIVISGDKVLYKQPWTGMVERDGKLVEECLDIPLSQFRQLDDDIDDDPMGRGLVDKLGPIDEVRAFTVTAWIEYLDRLMHPITYLPLGSIVNPDQWRAARDGTPIYYNPQGKPEQERIDPFPPDGKEFFDRTTEAGNSATGLQETAQGTEVPSVNSGVQAAVVVQEAQKNMSTIRHNVADGTERFWRVVTQLFRTFFTVPMQMKYMGEDGGWRRSEWSRADLGSTRHIKIKAGSFTQLSQQQKEAIADKQLQSQVIDLDEYRRVVSSGIRPQLGLKENPHIIRVRRQISAWNDGPKAGWQPPQAPTIPGPTGRPVPAVDPATNQPVPAPADPANPFADRRLIDSDPAVAKQRYIELGRHQSEASYLTKPPAWRKYLDDAVDLARREAGVSTIFEQQQAQQQQAQMQNQQRLTEAQQSHANDLNKMAAAGDQKLTMQDAAHKQDLELRDAEARAAQVAGQMPPQRPPVPAVA